MGKYTLPPNQIELAPGCPVLVPVQSWAEGIADQESLGKTFDSAAEKAAWASEWLDDKLTGFVEIVLDATTKEPAFADADEVRSLSRAQIEYLLAARRGEENLPATFLEWKRRRADEAADIGSDGGEVQLPPE